jgi:hypothetical protein
MKLTYVTGAVLGIAVGMGFSAAMRALTAQKAEKGTQQWEIPVAGPELIRLRVFDTNGVCLYLASNYGGTPNLTIAAISKAQLPPGAGCQ